MTEPPEAPDRVTEQTQGDRGARHLPAGLLAIVVIASMAVLSYGLVRMFSGKRSVGNGKIAFVAQGEGRGLTQPVNLDIYLMNPDGTEVINLTASAAEDRDPAWSPDGTQIAFSSDRAESRGSWPVHMAIYVMNADGTDVRRLTETSEWATQPAWSPDGKRIAFVRPSGASDNDDIFVMNSDGTKITRLTDHAATDAQPTWSPDGTRIAFASERDGNWDIYVVGVDGGGLANLTRDLSRNPAPDLNPAWSPDGTMILFRSQRDHDGGPIREGTWPDELYVMRVDGSDTTRLTNNVRLEQHPSWAPDGSKIVFGGAGFEEQALYVMNPEETTVALPNEGHDPTWQPLPGRGRPPEPAFALRPSPLPDQDSRREPLSCPDTEFGCVAIGPGEPAKIGLFFLIGDDNGLGSDSQNGVLLAMELRDTPGEIAGHSVEFVYQNDGCSAEGGQAGAQAFVDDSQIVGVIGPSCSSAALGVADNILSEAGIVLISPSNTGPALTDPATHQPFYLRTAYNDRLQGLAMSRFAFEVAGASSASTIHDGSPYADGLTQVFADTFTSLGGTIARQEAIQVGTTDFNSLLAKISADDIDFLYYPIFVAEGGLTTAQARETPGLRNTDLAGADAMFNSDWIQAAGAESAEGVYISDPRLTPRDPDFLQNEILPAYEERFSGKPRTEFYAYAFDAMNLLADAIEAVAIETEDDGLLIPRTTLKNRLFATEGYEGLTGLLTCNENGDCQPEATVAIHRVSGGRFGKPIKTYRVSLEEVGKESIFEAGPSPAGNGT